MHNLFGALPHQAMHRFAQRHGPVMLLRLGHVQTLVLSSAEAAMEATKVHGATFAYRPEYTTGAIFFANAGQNISLAERVRSFGPVREEEAARLVMHTFVTMSASGPVLVNVSEMVKAVMNDIFMRVAVGEMVKPKTSIVFPRVIVSDGYPQWAVYLEELDRAMGMSGVSLTDLFPTSSRARSLGHRPLRVRREARGRIQSIIDAMIRYHKAAMEQADHAGHDYQREDILTTLLRLQSDRGTGGVTHTNENISNVLFDIFSAGSEMAATTIIWAMSELIRSPRVMAIAQSEVRRFLHGKSLTEANIDGQLHYVKMVIKETFRLHPPMPLLHPMSCTEPGKIMGYDVPRGTTVFLNIWAIGRDEERWTDASEFQPERFKVKFVGGKVDYGDLDFGFFPEGVGHIMWPWMMFGCSNIEMVLANLLYHFDWTLPGGGKPEDLDMAEAYGNTTRRRTQLLLNATDYFGKP